MSERIKFEYNIIEFPQGFKKNNIEREALNDLGRNYMRNWKVCLHEYLNEFFKK